MSIEYTVSKQNKIRQLRENAAYDQETVHEILDAGLVAHVAFVQDGAPVVVPMLYGRERETLYLHGARLLEGYPFVPMMSNQALCVALLSYAGGLYWGFNVDRDAITDVPTLARCFVDEFDDLRKAAGDGGAAASVRPRTTGPLAATATVAKRAHRASRRPPRKRSSSARSARN